MQRCAFTPYEGKKPYIFVSYAHKDSQRVFPILEELDRRGYRVWYDDGIAPGSEWPENIAQHLDGCSLTLAFISPASIASANCRREVTFALSKRKPFLGILLEPTEMSLGMEMQLSAQQCIMKYTYPDDNAFFAKVCSCPDLQPCLGQPKPVPQPTPAPVQEAPAPAPKPTLAPKPAPAPKPKPAPIPREKKPLDKKLLAIIGGAAAAVVVLVIVLVIALSGGNKGPNADHTTPPQDTTSTAPTLPQDPTQLEYTEQNITAEDMAYISQQTKLESLKFYDCVFEKGALAVLTLPGTLTEVILDNCQGVDQLYCLADLENLEILQISDCDILNNVLIPLSSTTLYHLNISGNPSFSDLSLFAGCTGLQILDFSGTSVSNIDTLASLKALTHVNGSHTQVSKLDPLAQLTNLLELRFSSCQITSASEHFLSLYLHTLDLSYNDLFSISGFEYCTVLENVNLAFCDLGDTKAIAKSSASLKVLNLSGNVNLFMNDLYFLEDCANMQELFVDGIRLYDLDILQNMTMLQKLSAADCSLDDLNGLQSTVRQLRYLNLCANYIEDISVLSGLEGEDLYLDLSFNDYLEDLSALPTDVTFAVLNLVNSELDYTTLGAVQVDSLLLLYRYDLEKESFLQTDPCASYVIVACPMDKVVAMETLLGRNEITFLADVMEYIEYILSIDENFLYLEFAMTQTG